MNSFIKTCSLALVTLGLLTGTASARDWNHDRGYQQQWRGDHGNRGWHRDVHRANYGWYNHRYGYWRGVNFMYVPQPVYYSEAVYEPYYPAPVVVQQPQQISFIENQPAVTYNDNRYCREYQSRSVVNGQMQQTYGTACRQPDGAWQIIN